MADVNELPANTRPLLWPVRSPVMRWPTCANRPSFLMSIWMIRPALALVAAHGLDRLESAAIPVEPRRGDATTVAAETPVSAAIARRSNAAARKASICAAIGAGVGRLSLCGRDERPCNPAKPSALKRSTICASVRGQTPAARAAASGVCPLSISAPAALDRAASNGHSCGCSSGPPARLKLRQPQLPRSGPDGQPNQLTSAACAVQFAERRIDAREASETGRSWTMPLGFRQMLQRERLLLLRLVEQAGIISARPM